MNFKEMTSKQRFEWYTNGIEKAYDVGKDGFQLSISLLAYTDIPALQSLQYGIAATIRYAKHIKNKALLNKVTAVEQWFYEVFGSDMKAAFDAYVADDTCQSNECMVHAPFDVLFSIDEDEGLLRPWKNV